MLIKRSVIVGNTHITSGEIQNVVDSILDQKYLHIFTKRNALIYPKENIKKTLLETYPRIADLEIYTESFELLNIKIEEREAVAVWCAPITCYLADKDAYIYAEKHELLNTGALDAANVSVGTASSSLNTSVSSVKEKDEYANLPVLHGGDEHVGPEPIGKYIFNPTLFADLLYTITEINKLGLKTQNVHVFSRDEIVFMISNGGKIIFADRKPFAESIENLKSALKSDVFAAGGAIRKFEYIDTRFGNKIFYRLDTTANAANTLNASSVKGAKENPLKSPATGTISIPQN